MKNLLFAALLMVASLTLFASCQKNEADIISVDDTEMPVVHLELSNGDLSTKTFFDDTANAESFEKTISTLSIYVFDSNGAIITKRNFTTGEINAKSCTFSLPKTVAGTKCQFYAVANYEVNSITSKKDLLDALESNPGDYNGTFADVTTKAMRTNGFVMTAATETTVAGMGSKTEVSMTLKRTVAKVAVKVAIDKSFDERYGGILTILSTTIENAPSSVYLIEPSDSITVQTKYSTSQQIEEDPYGLYYIYENEYIKNHGNVVLKINAEYDLDGNFATKDDRYSFSYNVPLTGSGKGTIKRNGYYRISATIFGPEGDDCSLSFTVSDWESPSTQNVELGN